jgi:3-hydroxybutyryl-CoA dehydrogenase
VTTTLEAWSSELGKRPIVLHVDTPGFVANRLQYALLREGYALVEAGVCRLEDVDLAVTAGLGARWAALGPFQTMDLAGLDVHASVAGALFPELSNATEVPATLTDARTAGAGGAKAGRGLLGAYPRERLAALEERRDRCLVQLADGTG